MADIKRLQVKRSSVTGKRVASGKPGTLSVNWADRKLYVEDPAGAMLQLAQAVRDFDPALVYYPDDLCIYNEVLFRATANTGPGGFDPSSWTALSDATRAALAEPFGSALLSGGRISILDPAARTVNIAAGRGVVFDVSDPSRVSYQEVSWSSFDAVVTVPTDGGYVAVGIDASGSVLQFDVTDAATRRDVILLGQVLTHAGSGTLVSVLDSPDVGGQLAETFADSYWANGGPYKIYGLDLSPVGGDMQMQLDAGLLFSFFNHWRADPKKPHEVDIPATSPVTFDVILQDFTVYASDVTAIDPTVYDDGGTVTPVPAQEATVQYLMVSADGSKFYVLMGQKTYPTLNDAINDVAGTTVVFPRGLEQFIMLGAVVVREDCTDLADSSRAALFTASPGQRGRVQQGFEFSDQHLLPRDGSRPMTGDLDVGGNQIIDAVILQGSF